MPRVIEPDAGTAEIWTPLDRFPRMESERLVWMAPGASRSFELELAELLKPI